METKNALSLLFLFVLAGSVSGVNFQQTPYVQHPATNAMSLIWFTDSACEATVKWRPEAGGDERQAVTTGILAPALTNNVYQGESGVTPKYRHRVRMTDLAAGTRYNYSVTLPNGTSYANTFKTAPDANSSIRFMYFNDSETKPNNPKTSDWADPNNNDKTRTYYITPTEGYKQGLARMKSRNPDLFVMAGDLAWQSGFQTHWDEFWRHNAGGLGLGYDDPAGSIPILAAIGNHDLQDAAARPPKAATLSHCEHYQGGESALERYLSYFEYEPNGVDFSDVDNRDRSQMFHRVDYGPVTLIFLDTNNGDDSDPEKDTNTGLFRDPAVAASYGLPAGRSPDFNPGSKQYTWLTNQLADAQQKAKFTFVVNHQCPYSAGYHNRTNVTESGEWLSGRAVRVLKDAMLKYGVDGWLCGHDEMMEHARIEGEEILPDGTARPHSVDVFDMGTIGNGLRGGFITNEGKNLVKTQRVYEDGTKEIFRAYVDEPEVWENGVLVAGGVHYTHMEVDVQEAEPGLWTCTMTPNYLFTSNANGRVGSEWRTYNDVLVLTNDLRAPVVPEGMLVLKTAGTLASSMAVEGASLADISSYTQIVVNCQGTIKSDTSIASWTGDLRIRAGAVLEVTVNGALGAASGKIFIENGGQLKMAMATAATWVQTKKTCYFEGEGPDGMGALYNTSPNHENGNCLWPYTLIMTGDARWYNGGSGSQDVYGGSIDMNGHTLTYGINGRFHNVTIRNPGHIVVVKGGMLIQGNCNFGGTDENTITFKSGSICRFWGGPGTTPWTLVLDTGSSLYPGNATSDWQGPVVLNAPIPMMRWNEDIVMRFTNVVSGVGGITYSSGRTTRMTLHLSNPDNDFQGGVSLNESTLQLTASGALPMSGGAARIKNGTVLLSGLTHYDLPAAELMATGMVLNGTGRWHGGLVKKEAGTLVYESGVGGDLLDIQGGCVKFVHSNRGLFEGIVTGQGLFDAAWNAGLCPTNAIADCPRYSYLNTSSGWKDYMYVSYTGYLWNRSSEPVVWTFGCDIDDNAQLAINDTVVINHAGWTKPSFGTVTLNPGANKFTWRMVNWTGGGGGTAGQNNPWSLAKALAYHVGATESTNPADYTAFTAADAGTLFTITDGTNPDELKQFLPVFNKVRLASGTELDLNGFSYVVQELEGPGRVSNGQLTVASKWTMSAADIRTGNSFETTDALAFAEGAVVDVSDIAQLPVVSSDKAYVLGRAAQVTGTPAVSSALAVQKWRVRVEENVVKLYHNSGITIFVR